MCPCTYELVLPTYNPISKPNPNPKSINKCDRESARRRTDTHTDRLTDTNRFSVPCYMP